MLSVAAFYVVQIAVSLYAMMRGGAPERIVAVLLLVAAVATSLAYIPLGASAYGSATFRFLAIDGSLWLLLCGLSLFANRYWPMWLAALHLVGIAAHCAKVYRPDIAPPAYWFLASWISIPMLAVLLVGTMRHRARQACGLKEAGWSWTSTSADRAE